MADVNYPALPAAAPPDGEGKAPLLLANGKTSGPAPVQYVAGLVRFPDGFRPFTGWVGCKKTDPKSHLQSRTSEGGKGRPSKGTAFTDCGRKSGVQGDDFLTKARKQVGSQIRRSSRDVAPFAKTVFSVVGAVVGGGAGIAVGNSLGGLAEAGLAGRDPKKAEERRAKLNAEALAKALRGELGPQAKREAQGQDRLNRAAETRERAARGLELEQARRPLDGPRLARAQADYDRAESNFAATKREVCSMFSCADASAAADIANRDPTMGGAGGADPEGGAAPFDRSYLLYALAAAGALILFLILRRK